MALDSTAPATGQQLESAIEAPHKLRRAQGDYSCGCQFDGERNSVEALADFDNSSGVFARQREVGLHSSRPFDEEVHCVGVDQASM